MKDVIGLINDTMNADELKDLTKHRSFGSIPFGGRYRLIDFTLSNMANSGINNIGIFTQIKSRSLLDHLGTGKNWNLNHLYILPPIINTGESLEKFGDVDYFSKHKDYIEKSKEKYILLANSNCIYNLDLNLVKKFFFDSLADIVMVYKRGDGTKGEKIINLDVDLSSKRIVDIAVQSNNSTGDLYCHVIFMRKEMFLGLVDYCVSRGLKDFIKDGIIPRLRTFRVMAYEYKGFYGQVNNLLNYYRLNKALLEREVWDELFIKNNPILTKVQHEPPAKYLEGSSVDNSLVANGCIIEGKVINSILFRGVKVKKGSVIKDSIVMQKGVIGEKAVIENTILDKEVQINNDVKIISPLNYPIVIERKTKI
ncbi:glucose-1-phosphate adenylyltransferase subunit GlgD [Anaerobranca gottschalkii]|uniref:Glucose-1-phosphate adenylyltransferase n=1 Tax=Anaerobranca gottschalkii DSM 13577 TaxID=1120990 RepID=A0A1I0ADM5_9FIRM|nr:glucose-1-phosphate adenylyltransferase subunit GlgD [Anaerobranca gottschalkii]SES91340.1 glucose-1-phosphate adenylyltransferase [Anaerobranca gottschalkii DSM 13577]